MNRYTITLPFGLRLLRTFQRVAMMMTDCDDTRLYDCAERRFNAIVSEHTRLISKVCYCYASSRQDFEDMRQDCLINIWRGLGSFDGRSRLSSWLYRLCINTCITSWRAKKCRPQMFSFDEIGEMADNNDEEKSRSENVELLHAMIASLPYVDRAIILMWLDGCPYDDIAGVTGLSNSNIAVRIHRLKKRIAN